jgi:hypothetical protein
LRLRLGRRSDGRAVTPRRRARGSLTAR